MKSYEKACSSREYRGRFMPQKDVHEHNLAELEKKGYLSCLTEEEWKSKFPKIDAEKVFYMNGIGAGTAYYDGTIFVNVSTRNSVSTPEQIQNQVLAAIVEQEKCRKQKEYIRLLLPAPAWLIPEMLSNILELDGPSAQFYEVFWAFYEVIKPNISSFGPFIWEQLKRMKAEEQVEETRKYLDRDFSEDDIMVYLGWNKESVRPEQATAWKTTIESAFHSAWGCEGKEPKLTNGIVRKEQVLEYFHQDRKEGAEAEIIVVPCQVKVQKTVSLAEVEANI